MEGEYFSWLSHDDVYYPNKVEEQVLVLRNLKNKKTILYSNVEYIDVHSKLIYRTKYEKKYSNKDLNIGIFPVLKGLSNGCALLIPKICFEESGLFNENLRTSNDYEMWFRLFRKYEIKFIPEVLIKYRLHDKQGTKIEPSYLEESNRLWSFIISDLKEKEILKFEDSLFDFYYKMAKQMEESNFQKAYKVSNTFAKKQYLSRTPRVSVIMPCYNTEKYLAEAIESILKQTFCDFELIIVDDSSTDKSPQIIRQYKKKDYRIVSVSNKNKKGISGAMNTGISVSRASKYITRMDSDDISLPERLQKQVSFLETNKEYVFCSVNISEFGERESDHLFEEKDVPLEALFIWSNPIACAPTMIRKEILLKNKIKFRDCVVAEDYDLFSRLILVGKPAMLYEVLYKYRIHSDSIYHQNLNIVNEKTLQINRQLVSSLTGSNIPPFYELFTDFAEKVDYDIEISYFDIVQGVKLLIESAKNFWKWTDEEYQKVLKDAFDRVLNHFILRDLRFIEAKKEIDEKRREIMLLSEKIRDLNNELNKITSSKSWKITSPLRKLYRLIYLFKTQGFRLTIRNIYLKIITKLRE